MKSMISSQNGKMCSIRGRRHCAPTHVVWPLRVFTTWEQMAASSTTRAKSSTMWQQHIATALWVTASSFSKYTNTPSLANSKNSWRACEKWCTRWKMESVVQKKVVCNTRLGVQHRKLREWNTFPGYKHSGGPDFLSFCFHHNIIWEIFWFYLPVIFVFLRFLGELFMNIPAMVLQYSSHYYDPYNREPFFFIMLVQHSWSWISRPYHMFFQAHKASKLEHHIWFNSEDP